MHSIAGQPVEGDDRAEGPGKMLRAKSMRDQGGRCAGFAARTFREAGICSARHTLTKPEQALWGRICPRPRVCCVCQQRQAFPQPRAGRCLSRRRHNASVALAAFCTAATIPPSYATVFGHLPSPGIDPPLHVQVHFHAWALRFVFLDACCVFEIFFSKLAPV